MEWRRILASLILLTASFFAGFETLSPPNWLKKPEWWQVIVAAVGIGVIAWQAWLTRKAVEAAETGAKAARDNVELLISKDRARIEIIAGSVPVVGNAVIGSLCYLNNVGPSLATIEDGGIALVEGNKEIDVDYARCVKVPIVGNIPANGRSSGQFLIPLQPEVMITDSRALEIREGKIFIHCFGYISYRDVFERRHRVRLHLRWFMRWGGMLQGQVMEWWEPVGKPEENSDTEIRTSPEKVSN
jgi:hypothetical protein